MSGAESKEMLVELKLRSLLLEYTVITTSEMVFTSGERWDLT